MAQQIYLHVGSPKTGTTFLQQVLWSQRALAESQGLQLPGERFNDHFLATLDVRGVAGPPHPDESVGAWNRLSDDARSRGGTVLISHELFAAADKDQAHKAVGWLGADVEVHVVITARDYVRQVTAEWQEHVKHRNKSTLGEFVGRIREQAPERRGWFWLVQDYADLAQRWGSRIPQERVHVITVPPKGSPGALLWDRFAGLLGLDPAAFELSASRTNPSLGREQAEVLRRVNIALGDLLPHPGPYSNVVKDILAHGILGGQTGGTPLKLTPEDAAFARAESERVAERLGAMGVDVIGSLDDLVPDDAAVAAASDADAYAVPSDEAMLADAIAAITGLLDAINLRNMQHGQQSETVEAMQRRPIRTALSQAAEERPALDKARGLYRRLRQP